VQIVIYSLLDFFLEAKIDGFEGITGRVRGFYLATMNFTYTVGPYVAGFIISRYSFTHLYLFTAAMSLVFLLLVSRLTRNFHDAKYPHITLGYIARTIFRNASVAKILAINFLLQMRYAIVVIYLTVYLHQVLGFSIEVIGFMVMVAGIPFFLIQYPLGAWADRRHGERKMMVYGFIVTSVGALLLAFTPTTSIPLMTAILTIMFAGGAMIEVMSESFFFKHVKSRDDAHLVAFRMLIPAAYLSAPFFTGAVLAYFPMNYLFVGAAAVSIFGIPLAISLGSRAHRTATVRAFT